MSFNPKNLDKISLPIGWNLELLGKYSNIVTSFKTFQKAKTEYSLKSIGLPIHYLKVSDMNLDGNQMYFVNANIIFHHGTNEKLTKGFLQPNSLVFPKRGAAISTNKKRITTTYSILDPNLIGIEPYEEIDILFLYFFFELFDLKWLQDNNVIPQLNKHNVAGVKLPIPPKPEQHKIIYILSTVQKAIENQNKLIRTTTELKKALMEKLITEGTRGEKQKQTEIGLVPESWEVVRLYDYVEKTKLKDPLKNPNVEIIYVDVSSVNNKLFKVTETNKIFGKDAPSRARKLIQTDDVIFATVRPTLKRIAKITEDLNNQVCSTGYCVLKPMRMKLDSEFLYQYLQLDDFISRIEKLQRGASYPAVRDSDVKGMKIPLPKYDEQITIGNYFRTLDQKKSNATAKKQNLTDLFKTLLHQLMTGQRRVHEFDFEALNNEYQIKEQPLSMAAEI